MSQEEHIEIGLYNLGWTISWALASWIWWTRAAFGAFSLTKVVVLVHRIDVRSEENSSYDETRTLHA
jgi:hypothetical protein